MIGLVGQLGSAVTSARNKVAQLHAQGMTPTTSELADYIMGLFAEYDPELGGSKILSQETRTHLALGLAGVLLAAMHADGALEPIGDKQPENRA
jgi:hypothetical protein